MFMLRSVVSYDAKKSAWKYKMATKDSTEDTEGTSSSSSTSEKHTEGSVSQSVVKMLGSDMYENHLSFIIRMQKLAGKDRVVLMLLTVIELLSPDRTNLTSHETIRQGQERNSEWLLAYLMSQNPPSKAYALHKQLLDMLHEVRNLSTFSCQLVMNLDFSKLGPLLLEVFD